MRQKEARAVMPLHFDKSYDTYTHNMGIVNGALVSIEDKTHPLENPVRDMVCSGQVSIKHQPHPHGIAPL